MTHTPRYFVEACDEFTFLGDSLASAQSLTSRILDDATRARFLSLLTKAMALLETEDGWVHAAALGTSLRHFDPDFRPKDYGHRRLLTLLQSFQFYVELKPTSAAYAVRLRSSAN